MQMTREYSMACTEVLEILKYLPKEEKEKIPAGKIEFYEANKAFDYQFEFDPNQPIEEQNISKTANAIIITIFRDYFATDEQRNMLSEILKENTKKVENKRFEKYGRTVAFNTGVQPKAKPVKTNKLAVVKKKKNFFEKVIDTIKQFFI